jgi:hypothetical protein
MVDAPESNRPFGLRRCPLQGLASVCENIAIDSRHTQRHSRPHRLE